MKKMNMFMIIGMLLLGLSGCSATGPLSSVISADSIEKPLVSAQDHLNHAQMLQEELKGLEEQVSRINQKVARYDQKPYLDPKRFRRDGLKILRGSNLKEIETLQEKVAWHRAQASRLASLDSSQHDQAVEDRNIMKEEVSLSGSGVSKKISS